MDLAGHTGGGRLDLFAARAAPVQLTWLGYPNITGIPAMDGRITDARSDPADLEGAEPLLRLPETFLCYGGDPDLPLPPLRDPSAPPVLASFNQLPKLNGAVIAAWAQILAAVPEAQLLLKARELGDPGTAARLRASFEAAGTDPERLTIMAQTKDWRAHMALYGEVDLALDPFPYAGTTTSCEALWMETPVLTLAGDRHAARVGASLLGGLGLESLIAWDRQDYIARAVALLRDRTRLQSLSHGLRARMRSAPLCDAPRFARAMEALYRGLV